MGRRPDPARKAELLAAVVQYLGEHGMADASLRPLAEAIGVSTYALSYHFNSKEELLADAVAHVEDEQRQMLEQWQADDRETAGDALRRYFRWSEDPPNQARLRLLFEILDLGAREPDRYREACRRLLDGWTRFLAGGLRQSGRTAPQARAEATLLLGTVLGLHHQLLATGDRRRVRAAVRLLAERIDTPAG